LKFKGGMLKWGLWSTTRRIMLSTCIELRWQESNLRRGD
jgi:hypothetical protein